MVPHSPSGPLCSRFSLRKLRGQVWQDLAQPHCSCCHCRVGEAQLVPRHNSGLQLLRGEGLQAGGHVGVSNSCNRPSSNGGYGLGEAQQDKHWKLSARIEGARGLARRNTKPSALPLLHDASGCIHCCPCALKAEERMTSSPSAHLALAAQALHTQASPGCTAG